MKFFGNRAVAAILAVVVVCGSTLLNTRIKLGEACRAAEDTFYTSESGSRSIYSRLDARLDAANGLWSILTKYDQAAADKLGSVRASLASACERRDIGWMYDANKDLQSAFDEASAALAAYTLADTDLSAAEDYRTAFAGAQKLIDESGYNADVLAFMRATYDKFPANILADLAGVEAPQLFE